MAWTWVLPLVPTSSSQNGDLRENNLKKFVKLWWKLERVNVIARGREGNGDFRRAPRWSAHEKGQNWRGRKWWAFYFLFLPLSTDIYQGTLSPPQHERHLVLWPFSPWSVSDSKTSTVLAFPALSKPNRQFRQKNSSSKAGFAQQKPGQEQSI